MYITISRQKRESTYSASCGDLVNYLEKEKEVSKEAFFSAHQDEVSPEEVIHQIDENATGKGLKDKDARFFSIVVSPSADELQTTGYDSKCMKEYVRDMMKEYCAGFNRENTNGQEVSPDDFVWYAKIETTRTFGDDDMFVKHNEKYETLKAELEEERDEKIKAELSDQLRNLKGAYVLKDEKAELIENPSKSDTVIKRGVEKQGDQRHIHIIVSRCHRTERRSFSPLANNRGGLNKLNGQEVKIGFNRAQFAQNCETIFDLKFNHNRDWKNSVSLKLNKKSYYEQSLHQQLTNKVLNGFGLNNLGVNQAQTLIKQNSYIQEQFLQGAGIDLSNAQSTVMQTKEAHRAYTIIQGADGLKSILLNTNLTAKLASEAVQTIKKTITHSAFKM